MLSRRLCKAFYVALTLTLAACGGSAADTETDLGATCPAGDVGDLSAPPELQLYNQRADGVSTPIVCGETIDMLTPPQGGRVSFIGLRVTNMSACGVKVTSQISEVNGGGSQEDSRTVDLEALEDGWAGSKDGLITTFSHLTMCPNEWSSSDIFDTEYELRVTVTDKAGRQASSTMNITPTCGEPDKLESCKCLCGAAYEPGVLCGN